MEDTVGEARRPDDVPVLPEVQSSGEHGSGEQIGTTLGEIFQLFSELPAATSEHEGYLRAAAWYALVELRLFWSGAAHSSSAQSRQDYAGRFDEDVPVAPV